MSEPLKRDDPAFWMLQKGRRLERAGYTQDVSDSTPWLKDKPVHRDGCYICEDPEFRLMGMPLCKPCPDCEKSSRGKGHIAADDTTCDDCGFDIYEAWQEQQEQQEQQDQPVDVNDWNWPWEIT